MTIVDLSSDRGFVHFANMIKILPELPEFVKEASKDNCAKADHLPSSAFGDSINRKFPVHTKAAAWLSYLYYKSQSGKFTKEACARIDSKFSSAAETWGIRTEMRQLDNDLIPKMEKQASADDYAIAIGDNYFFPINTPTNVTKSMSSLIEHRGNFTYSMRKAAATGIMKAAVQHGFATVDIPAELHRMSGFGTTTKAAAVEEIGRRIRFASKEFSSLKPVMTKLAEEVGGAAAIDPEAMAKIAVAIDMFDRHTKITDLYGTSFQFPEDVLFSFTEKTAEAIRNNSVVMITGTMYTMSELSKSATALQAFGDSFYNEVVRMDGSVDLQKIADVLPTMPRDEAALFDRAMRLS